ncbi:hypothetical protein [Halalkalicoccus tibetensis]|uniref:Uncharacterized protein n=1 Tax=Halalkalicoccus tibetensis TaxID=175632 RepID=A0ABD5V6I5_9EURY
MLDDQKIQREILKFLYQQWVENPRGQTNTGEVGKELEDIFENGYKYHLTRLNDNGYINTESLSARHQYVNISITGIEKLTQDGYETILVDDHRYAILRVLYEIDRQKGGAAHNHVGMDILQEEIEIDDETLKQNIWYLEEKRLVETGPGRMLSVQITARGRNRYEEHRNDNTQIPRTHTGARWTQHTIAQGDFEKANSVFRDFVELARDEVIIIDSYAKAGLYEMLEAVPGTVDVRVIGSDRQLNDEHREAYRTFARGRPGETELRFLEYNEWPFHGRYMIRDREDGYVWDHTFADSGSGHHTISEVRPVNLENTMADFDQAWGRGEVVE